MSPKRATDRQLERDVVIVGGAVGPELVGECRGVDGVVATAVVDELLRRELQEPLPRACRSPPPVREIVVNGAAGAFEAEVAVLDSRGRRLVADESIGRDRPQSAECLVGRSLDSLALPEAAPAEAMILPDVPEQPPAAGPISALPRAERPVDARRPSPLTVALLERALVPSLAS